MVTQIHKQQPAVVAYAVAPAGEPNDLANIRLAQGAAGVGTVTMHHQARHNGPRRIRLSPRFEAAQPHAVLGLVKRPQTGRLVLMGFSPGCSPGYTGQKVRNAAPSWAFSAVLRCAPHRA